MLICSLWFSNFLQSTVHIAPRPPLFGPFPQRTLWKGAAGFMLISSKQTNGPFSPHTVNGVSQISTPKSTKSSTPSPTSPGAILSFKVRLEHVHCTGALIHTRHHKHAFYMSFQYSCSVFPQLSYVCCHTPLVCFFFQLHWSFGQRMHDAKFVPLWPSISIKPSSELKLLLRWFKTHLDEVVSHHGRHTYTRTTFQGGTDRTVLTYFS